MLEQIGKNAKASAKELVRLGQVEKNRLLTVIAAELEKEASSIIEANKKDLAHGKEIGLTDALMDRLMLDEARITGIADGLRHIVSLPDPVGKVDGMIKRPNGLVIGKKRVPMGVIGIIYEARPNVTIDAFGLCFKSSNTVVLRGGKEAFHSNNRLVEVVRSVFEREGLNPDFVQIVTDTTRASATAMMKLNEYLDVLIPRGGAGLINAVVKNATVPVIETGTGNCHVYVDNKADLDKAVAIAFNAKARRVGVCNACETILVHEDVATEFINQIAPKFKDVVEIRGDETVCNLVSEAIPATTEDWDTEYLNYIVAIKTVSSVDEAIEHIETYSTHHSDAIVTEDYSNANKFLDEVDSAAVYVNASTAFTDGGEFGMGAEMGISTQKLHVRGPMGLEELTTIKYIIYGDGQIRS